MSRILELLLNELLLNRVLAPRPLRSLHRASAWMLPSLLAVVSLGCIDGPDGQALYRTHCVSCHSIDGTGDPRRIRDTPALDLTKSPLVEHRLDGRIYRLIDSGIGGMPAFSHKMDYQEMQAIARYTLTFAPATIETENDP